MNWFMAQIYNKIPRFTVNLTKKETWGALRRTRTMEKVS